MNGWVKLSRRLLSWEWHGSPEMMSMLIHLLLCANYEPSRWRGIVVGRGQLVSSRRKLARLTGLTERQARSCLERLMRTGEIVIEPSQRYSVITICGYDDYQGGGIEAVPTAVPHNDPLPSHTMAQSTAHDSDAATHCETVDCDVVDTTMRPAQRPNEISQVGPLCDPYSKKYQEEKNFLVDEREQKLNELRTEMLGDLKAEQLRMNFRISAQQLADFTDQILTEWRVAEIDVKDITRQHYLNTLRVKVQKSLNAAAPKATKQQRRADNIAYMTKAFFNLQPSTDNGNSWEQ